MNALISLALLGLVGWGVWQALQPRAVFDIRVADGEPHVVRGTVTKTFLREIRELCQHHGVTRGVVRGKARGNRIGLEILGSFPPAYCQQLRNVWAISGWSAGRPAARRGAGPRPV